MLLYNVTPKSVFFFLQIETYELFTKLHDFIALFVKRR